MSNKEQELRGEKRAGGLLVLSRKEQEGIIINPGSENQILIKVLTIGKKRVRLGIKAPGLQIEREERIT